jgi:RimJ/RimL family protein N-acetyltransferase
MSDPRAPDAPEIRVPEGVTIRPARPSDAASFLQMFRAVVAERRWVRTDVVTRSVRDQRRMFREAWSPSRAILVALDRAGRVIGNIWIAREEHPVNRHVASIGMAVAKEWRGRGVGSALMAEALRWAREQGVEKVALSVYPGNDRAAALYRKFGFVEEGRLVRQSKKSYGYEDEIVMARFL